MIIYINTIKGIAKQFKAKISKMHITKKINFTLLSCHLKFLNLNENILIGATNITPIIMLNTIINQGFKRISTKVE